MSTSQHFISVPRRPTSWWRVSLTLAYLPALLLFSSSFTKLFAPQGSGFARILMRNGIWDLRFALAALDVVLVASCLAPRTSLRLPLAALHFALLSMNAREVRLHGLIDLGRPFRESRVASGGFIMSTPEQLRDAKRRFQAGEMGKLAPTP